MTSPVSKGSTVEHTQYAAYAAQPEQTRGRRHPEAAAQARTEFQRDRDRIVHSTAFRRLEYKTQVFINHEGDLFRTRLTHSLEVAQIARSLARNLNLNEDLVEAISLAHDLGHTPFGHAGQDALHDCMLKHGGFEHNLQSLRTVDLLEERYAEFDGLNLCFETREGILKHCSLENARNMVELGDLAQRFLNKQQPSLEAQIANLADEIAYNNHDVDDGLRSGLITLTQLEEVPLVQRHLYEVRQRYGELDERRLIHETIRRMINTLMLDLLATSRARIAQAAPKSIADIRSAAQPLIAFSDEIRIEANQLKQFLMQNLYRHYKVMRMTEKAKRTIRELFNAFMSEPRLLPTQYQIKAEQGLARVVADYIAGMTDRFAIREHQQIFNTSA